MKKNKQRARNSISDIFLQQITDAPVQCQSELAPPPAPPLSVKLLLSFVPSCPPPFILSFRVCRKRHSPIVEREKYFDEKKRVGGGGTSYISSSRGFFSKRISQPQKRARGNSFDKKVIKGVNFFSSSNIGATLSSLVNLRPLFLSRHEVVFLFFFFYRTFIIFLNN